jgi:hypothetical protein
MSLDTSTLLVSMVSSSPKSSSCTDDYLLVTSSFTAMLSTTSGQGLSDLISTSVNIEIPKSITEAESWDLTTKGVRMCRFLTDMTTTLSNLLVTIDMFLPQLTQRVPPNVAAKNIDFMRQYPQFDIQPRDPLSSLPPPEAEVHSGDFFGIMRLDGLNPMLAWAMGSTTGHTTMALWIEKELYIVESDIASAFWPTDGVQKTPYKDWIRQAQEADYQVAWAPLSVENRRRFNETAAIEFFNSVQGLEYGFKTLLWGMFWHPPQCHFLRVHPCRVLVWHPLGARLMCLRMCFFSRFWQYFRVA